MWSNIESKNYLFHFHPNSLAHKELYKIIELQESCYEHITRVLNIKLNKKIPYYICNDDREVGHLYGDDDPCNGFCRYPDKESSGIYAVYNENVKCLGYHEDVHYITYLKFGKAKTNFIREGIAMAFDKNWHGIPNEIWVKNFIDLNKYKNIEKLLLNEEFFKTNVVFSYILGGAFTNFLILNYGKEKYNEFYKLCVIHNNKDVFKKVYDKDVATLESEFKKDLDNLSFAEFINLKVQMEIKDIII
ncbi:MAG: hypothetical protein ACRCW0_06055 [Clostridium sp.]